MSGPCGARMRAGKCAGDCWHFARDSNCTILVQWASWPQGTHLSDSAAGSDGRRNIAGRHQSHGIDAVVSESDGRVAGSSARQ